MVPLILGNPHLEFGLWGQVWTLWLRVWSLGLGYGRYISIGFQEKLSMKLFRGHCLPFGCVYYNTSPLYPIFYLPKGDYKIY